MISLTQQFRKRFELRKMSWLWKTREIWDIFSLTKCMSPGANGGGCRLGSPTKIARASLSRAVERDHSTPDLWTFCSANENMLQNEIVLRTVRNFKRRVVFDPSVRWLQFSDWWHIDKLSVTYLWDMSMSAISKSGVCLSSGYSRNMPTTKTFDDADFSTTTYV